MQISVRSASPSDKDILDNLLQYYLHDFSEFDAVRTDNRGRYHYPYLDHYWSDADRHPYLIYIEHKIAGFALVHMEADAADGRTITDLSEFFVLRVFRKQGVGSQAAVELWDLFPGNWQVRVLNANKAAYRFWKNVINQYTAGKYQEQDIQTPGAGQIAFSFKNR